MIRKLASYLGFEKPTGENRFKEGQATTGSGTIPSEPSGNRVSLMEKMSHDSTDSKPVGLNFFFQDPQILTEDDKNIIKKILLEEVR